MVRILALLLLLITHAAYGAGESARPHVKGVFFIPEQFIEPLHAGDLSSLATRLGTPVQWPDSRAIFSPLMTPSAAEGSAKAPKSAHFGTYLIALEGGKPGSKGLSFNINEAYRMYLVRGQNAVLLHEDGNLTTSADDSIYRLVPYSTHEAYFSFEGGDLWLLIQASAPVYTIDNRHYSSLGIASLKIGEASSIRTAQVSNQIYQTACFGAFLLLFMYQLAIYLLRRNDLSNLMIALAALAFLMRCLSEEQVLALYFEQSNALATYNSAIQFLRFIFLNSASFLVSYFLLKEVFTRANFNTLTVMNIITILIIVLVQLNPAVPGYWKDRALALLTVTILASALISAWLYFKAWKQAIPGAMFGLLGYTIGPILVGIDSLIIQGRIDFFRVGTLGLLFMTLASSLMTGQQAAEAYRQAGLLNEKLTGKNREIQDMNRDLELKVHDRTRELKTIFDNIPQGVASLSAEGIISPNYSRHLESILRETNLGGRSIVDFFQRTTLSPDGINRMIETFRACVGENSLSFLINEANLPLEVTVSAKSEPLFFALTWGVELAENDEVRSILMTIEDVTVKKRLEVESEKQRKDLLIIQELLQCEPEKFEIFARASEALLTENRRLIQAGALSSDDIKIMFINAHTVKGGARTLGMSGLANILHEIEHEYAQIMKNLATADQTSLASSMVRTWTVFDLYIAINRDKLGRKTNSDQVSVDIEFIKNHYKVLESLMLDNPTSPSLLLGSIRQARDQLARLIFKSDTHILEQCFEPAAKIAKDLGKPAPEIRLETSELQVPREVEAILRHALIHILRNAMDHGIEPAEERLSKGKNLAGVIAIRSHAEGEAIVIHIRDDGRGLALSQLKEKGLKNGHIKPDADAQTIANIIFLPGLTTAKSLSQISGRGVGMDAVKKFIEGGGGTIEVRPLQTTGDYIPFELSIRLPLQVA